MLPKNNQIIQSPGGSFTYKIIGKVCVLFDRENLPYPCCSLQWKGKQPSWRRVGRRYIPDISCLKFPSYYVELLDDYGNVIDARVLTVFWKKLSLKESSWWYSKPHQLQQKII